MTLRKDGKKKKKNTTKLARIYAFGGGGWSCSIFGGVLSARSGPTLHPFIYCF
jgi:hypothetical protein